MDSNWFAWVPAASTGELANLRTVPSLQILEDELGVWVSSHGSSGELSPEVASALRRIGGTLLYRAENHRLAPMNGRVPTRPIPRGNWAAIGDWCAVVLPRMTAVEPFDVRWAPALVPSTQERPAAALVTEIEAWCDYAASAPQIRLAPLQFAVAQDGRTIILGSPLPPVKGTFCYLDGPLLIAAGWRWWPNVSGRQLGRLFRLNDGELALCLPTDRAWERIPEEAWVAARRANVRATLADLRSDRRGGVR